MMGRPTVPEPAMTDRKSRAHPSSGNTTFAQPASRRRVSPDAYPGNSETRLTAADWERIVNEVWEKARVLPDCDPATWRQDACGAWIRREQFGDDESEYGWRIEKIAPEAGAAVELLRPFHWRNRYDIANRRAACDTTADRSKVPAGERIEGEPRNKRS